MLCGDPKFPDFLYRQIQVWMCEHRCTSRRHGYTYCLQTQAFTITLDCWG